MTTHYAAERTAVLLLDPYNDFLAEEGKLWPAVEQVAVATGTVDHMKAVVAAAREAHVKVFFVPHHRSVPGDFEHWQFPNPSQLGAGRIQLFAKDTWGGSFHDDFPVRDGDVVIAEHWAQSGFANTDLDQQLKQHGIDHVIVIGLLANTCAESTGRFAMEMGYHVTLVTDATAAYSTEAMHTAHVVNGPTYAHEILTTEALVSALAASPTRR